MIQVLELPLRVTSIHRLDSFKPFLKVEDWTHRRSRFSRSLSLQTNSSVDTDPILTYEIVGRGGGGGPWDTNEIWHMQWSQTNREKAYAYYSLKSRLIFPKPLFTVIEKNSCISICTRSDLNKIREETIKKYNFIDLSNHAKVYHFANNSVMA